MADSQPPNGELYTRGAVNMPDTRGQSMVAKHLDKLQQEKEERAIEKLRLLLPQLGSAVRIVALQECDWDDEKALIALRRFMTAKATELKSLQKERRRHQKRKEEKKKKSRRRDDSDDSSSSEDQSSDDDSSSEDSDTSSSDDDNDKKKDRRHRHRSSKRKERDSKRSRKDSSPSPHRKRKRKDKKESKDKKRKREKERRHKEKKARTSSKHTINEYGRYGIIRERDIYAKQPEFMLWATEVKGVDLESMPKFEEKELFKSYMEDFNTGTLPHKKYYDLESYEKSKKFSSSHARDTTAMMMLDDEKERKKELAAQREIEKQERLKAAYEELKTTKDKAVDMREQELLRAKMSLAYRTGDQKEAMRIAERLKPNET